MRRTPIGPLPCSFDLTEVSAIAGWFLKKYVGLARACVHLRISIYYGVCLILACEHRRISGFCVTPPKNNVCENEPTNDFHDVILFGPIIIWFRKVQN